MTSYLRRLDGLLVFAAAVAAVAVVWSGGLWLTNDGPQHVYSSFVPLHMDDVALGYRDFLEDHVPATALGFRAIFTPLEPLVGWQLAYRLTLVFAVLLWGGGVLALARSFDRQRTIIGVFGFASAFQLSFYLGFIPFLVASALGLFALAAWNAVPAPLLRSVVVATLLYLAGRAHVIGAVIAALMLAAFILVDERLRLRGRILMIVACMTPLGLVFLQTRVGDLSHLHAPTGGQSVEPSWLALEDRVFRLFLPGPWWRGAGTLTCIVLGVLLGSRGRNLEKILALASLALVLLAMVLPRDVFHWQLAGARPVVLGAAGALSLLAVEGWSGARAILARCIVVIAAAASLAWSWSHAVQLRERAAPLLAPLAELSPNPRWLAAYPLDPCLGPCANDIPGFVPALHLGQLYALVLGGEASGGQTGFGTMHSLVQRPSHARVPIPAADYARDLTDEQRAAFARRLAVWLSLQPAVLVTGHEGELEAFRDAGYAEEFSSSHVFLGTFEGCAGTIIVESARPGQVVQVGAWPLKEPAVEPILDDSGRAAVSGVPCGDVWLHLQSIRCRGTAPGLPVRALWRRGQANTLVCSAERDAP